MHLTRCCFALAGDPKGCRGRAESPLLASLHANFPEGESSLRVWRADYGAGAQVHLTRCCFALAGDPKGCRGRAKSPCLCRRTPASPKGNPRWGFDAPTTARLVGCRPEGGSTFFRSERKYQRKHAARRLQRRPTSLCTATKPCAALGLGYALHGFQPFLALVGLRPPWAVGFGLREPNGWMPRIYSGHPIPALRPEQSDHVPWADCPQGLSSTSARCAHPPGKRLLLPILPAGLAMSRAMELASFRIRAERARARLFPPSKWAGLFPSAAYRRSSPPQLALGRLKWRRLECFGVT